MKPIENLPGYSVTNCGKIYSHISKIYLAQSSQGSDYKFVIMRGKSYRIHRLVAKAFVPNPEPENFNVVNHKNGDKFNNNFDNLEWGDNSYNMFHAYKTGLRKPRKRAILRYTKDGKFVKRYGSVLDASKELKIDDSSICKVCSGRTKTVRGYIWKYETEEINEVPIDLEEWKFIPEYNDLYRISKEGQIWSIRHKKLLKYRMDQKKPKVCLKDKKQSAKLVHRLVAQTYIPNVNNHEYVLQRDGNPENVSLSNLEWGSLSDSLIASRLRTPAQNLRPVRQYDLDGVFIKDFPSLVAAKKEMGLKTSSGIHQCCSGRKPTCSGFKWSYADQISPPVRKTRGRRKVEQIDLDTGKTINIFNSIKDAKKALGHVGTSHISNVCCGARKKAAGYGWKYMDSI